MSHRYATPVAIGAIALVADQATKHIAAETSNWINYDIGTDRAISPMSTAVGTTAVLGLIALGLIALILARAERPITRILAAVVASGIIGTRIDQLGGAKVLVRWTTAHPAVINWITLPGGYICNIADLAIFGGVLGLSIVACTHAVRTERSVLSHRRVAAVGAQ